MASTARLPPLGTLRAFDAAARLGSFSAAAAEICVTHSAVSHQIRTLEQALGRRLFVRRGPGVSLTPEGTFLAERVRHALTQLSGAVEALAPRDSRSRVTLGVASSVASRWLMPRLAGFRERYPDVEVRIHATRADLGPADFDRDPVDVAMCAGSGEWPGLVAVPVLHDEAFPVCSPAWPRAQRPAAPNDIAAFALLRADAEPWTPWLRAAGLDFPEPPDVREFNDPGIMLQAAAGGEGIALARRSLVEDDLRRGVLVRLFAVATPAPAYFAAWPRDAQPTAAMLALREWLQAEGAARCAADRGARVALRAA